MCQSFDGDGFEIGVSMIEGLDSAVFDEGSGVGDDSWGSAADVRVDLKDFLNALGYD